MYKNIQWPRLSPSLSPTRKYIPRDSRRLYRQPSQIVDQTVRLDLSLTVPLLVLGVIAVTVPAASLPSQLLSHRPHNLLFLNPPRIKWRVVCPTMGLGFTQPPVIFWVPLQSLTQGKQAGETILGWCYFLLFFFFNEMLCSISGPYESA